MQDGVTRWARRLGGFLGVFFLLMGVAEAIGHLSDPVSLLFWLPALWGGGVLILLGVFRIRQPWASLTVVGVGGVAAMLATMWLVVPPLLTATPIVLVVSREPRQAARG